MKPLTNMHHGETICIMGGAPSLVTEIKHIRSDVYISCNHHAAMHYPADYVTCWDSRIGKEPITNIMRQFGVPIISPHHFSDFESRPPEMMINTGIYSAWVAKQMGAAEIIMVGFEFYQGNQVYYHGKGNVRDSNKQSDYFHRCIHAIKQLDAPIRFACAKIDRLINPTYTDCYSNDGGNPMVKEYDIIKSNFAGRAGYKLFLDPNSQKAQRLLSGGFIQEAQAEQPKPKKRRSKKVITPPENKA